MDELQISGKRYLSSRRVAKENGYHTDYIGQLIRGGKVKGQKVGRTWYVEAESFATYLGKEQDVAVAVESIVAPETIIASQTTAPAAFVAQPEVKQPEVKVEESTPIVSEKEATPTPIAIHADAPAEIKISASIAAAPAPVAVESTVEPMRIAAPTAPIIVRKVVPQSSVGLRVVTDMEPLLPEISRNDKQTRIAAHTVKHQDTATNEPFEERADVYAPRGNGRAVLALSAIAIVIFAASAVVSSGVFQTINIQANNPASVSYSMHW